MPDLPAHTHTDCTYGRESLCDVWNDIQPLLYLHWREIATHQDIPLAPIREHYEVAERAGLLRIFTARTTRDGLIGYAVYYVSANPHYRSSIVAVQDVIFLHPDWRRGGIAMTLLRYCDAQLKDGGVQIVTHHVKNKHPALGRVLERLGYEAQETTYFKRLDR